MGLSIGHIILVLVIILILFGAGKLPRVMADLARGIRAFKDGMTDEETPLLDSKPRLPSKKKTSPKALPSKLLVDKKTVGAKKGQAPKPQAQKTVKSKTAKPAAKNSPKKAK